MRRNLLLSWFLQIWPIFQEPPRDKSLRAPESKRGGGAQQPQPFSTKALLFLLFILSESARLFIIWLHYHGHKTKLDTQARTQARSTRPLEIYVSLGLSRTFVLLLPKREKSKLEICRVTMAMHHLGSYTQLCLCYFDRRFSTPTEHQREKTFPVFAFKLLHPHQ